jgi:hypothetical protein
MGRGISGDGGVSYDPIKASKPVFDMPTEAILSMREENSLFGLLCNIGRLFVLPLKHMIRPELTFWQEFESVYKNQRV